MGRSFFRAVLFLLLLVLPARVLAQEMYRTIEGRIQVQGKGKGGEGLTAISDKLFVRVDHGTGDIFMKLDQRTLKSGIDSIDRRLDSLPDEPIRFEGQLKRGGFDPNRCYSSTPLRIRGTLIYRDMEKDIRGTGSFKSRFSNDRIPCMLEIGFEMELEEAEEKGFLPGFEENVRIHILQAILNPGR
jgi:hypothetical protein